jgi:outer membrane protein assembly factor BamB
LNKLIKILTLSTICNLGIWSCVPTESIITDLDNTSNLPVETVWQVPLMADTSFSVGFDPVEINNVLFIGVKPSALSTLPMRIQKVSTEKGNILLTIESDDNYICSDINLLESAGHFVQNEYFYFNCSGTPHVWDMRNMILIAAYSGDSSTTGKISGYNELLFYSTRYSYTDWYDSSSLIIVNPLSGNSQELFTVSTTESYNPSLYPPAVYLNASNDTILFFQNRQWNFANSSEGGKVDLYCYNMTADSIVWLAEDIDPYGNSSVCLPLYHEGKVYFRGFRTLHCLDALTGEQLWMHEFTGEFNDLHLGNMLVAEGKLVVKSSDRGIHAFDPESGSLLWERFDTGITSCYMNYYNGSVFFGSYDGKLFNVRVSDGKILWAIESPNAGKSPSWEAEFWNGVAIDEENNRIITTDGYYLICLQL